METKDIFDDMEREMQKSVDHVLHEFASLHTGKANTSMVESVNVDVYGSNMKLRDVAAITTPDARTIQIQPWDKTTVGPIEKALIEAKLGINPVVTGELIRLPGRGMPSLRGGRRGELVVALMLEIPKKLSERQSELLREYAALEDRDVLPENDSFWSKIKSYIS